MKIDKLEPFFIDFDNTLIKTEYNKELDKYEILSHITSEIAIVNELYDKGYLIIIYTARRWHHYKLTKQQLFFAKIKYHELVMGKPLGKYIDADNLKSAKEYLLGN